jgi:hypothetical protein
MTATSQMRICDLGGAYHAVRLMPGASALDVKEAIATAVQLAVGTFGLRNAAGGTTVIESTLTGDWIVVPLPAPPATPGGFS